MSVKQFIEKMTKFNGDEPVEPVVETPEVPEEPTEPVEPVEPSPEEPVEQVETPAEPQEPSREPEVQEEPTESQFNVDSWLEENEGTLRTYLEYKNTDFQAMSPEEVVERKLRKDNPEWTEEDIRSELRDKYGLGLTKVDINEDDMTSDEIKEAKEVNRLVEQGSRQLKSAAKEAREFFEEEKKSLKAPEINIQTPDVDDYLQTVLKEEQEKAIKQHESWKAMVDPSVSKLTTIKRTLTFEDNGAPVELTVDYKLSEKQKEQLAKYLHNYSGHPEADKSYIQEDGSVKIDQFSEDKAALLFHEQMMISALKEYGAKVRASLVKKDLLNHDDGVRNATHAPTSGEVTITDVQKEVWARRGRTHLRQN